MQGISIKGENSSAILSGQSNIIRVESDSSDINRIHGVFVEKGGSAYVENGHLFVSVNKKVEAYSSADNIVG